MTRATPDNLTPEMIADLMAVSDARVATDCQALLSGRGSKTKLGLTRERVASAYNRRLERGEVPAPRPAPIGRPPSSSPLRTKQIKVQATEDLYARVAKAATAAGRTMSDWGARAFDLALSMAPRGEDERLDRANAEEYRKLVKQGKIKQPGP